MENAVKNTAKQEDRGILAPKPPMGFNTWNTFCWHINEKLVLELADAMAEGGYRDAGYNIFTIDDCWMLADRDADGNLAADPGLFPNGMKFIGDYLHERGLKFGIYADGGTSTCAGRAGSFGYERKDAKLFASWGVDFLKYDFCYPPPGCDDAKLFRRMGQALRETGRDIIYSASYSLRGVWEWMRTAGAHMWRTYGDIKDNFYSICEVGCNAMPLSPYAGPSGWNDLDMLVAGLYGKGFVGEIGGGSNDTEYETHFALWCMLCSPLFMGHDLRNAAPAVKKILLNEELIAINQDSAVIPAYRIPVKTEKHAVLAKPLKNGDIALMVLNRSAENARAPLSWDYCGLEITDEVYVRDLINHRDLGVFRHGFSVMVKPHGCVAYRIRRVSR